MDAQTQLNEAVALLIGNLTIENQALKLQLAAAREQIAALMKPPPSDDGHAK
jgi:hypothetical protein